MIDFLQTESEVELFNKEGYSINMVMTIKDIPVPLPLEDETAEP